MSVGVRQGCILSPCLFNVFLEEIMQEALSDFTGTVSVGGRNISNLRFADDIDLIAGSKDELKDLTERLDSTARSYGMEISREKSKVMVTSRKNNENVGEEDNTDIKVNGEVLEEVSKFQYLGSTLNEDITSKDEIKKRLAIATGQLAKLNKLWSSRNILLPTKFKLMHSLITSIALYGCEAWTYSVLLEKRIEAFEMRCCRRLLGISWKDHRTKFESVRSEIRKKVGEFEPLLEVAQKRKLRWFWTCKQKTWNIGA